MVIVVPAVLLGEKELQVGEPHLARDEELVTLAIPCDFVGLGDCQFAGEND